MPDTYYVAGAGIAGLTLALALAKFGQTVVVLERNQAISEFGAGLQISPNARKILNNLGLSETIAAHSLEPFGLDIYPHRSHKPLTTLALGTTIRDRFGAPYAVMHRADLADSLYKACRRFANIDILFGVRDWDVVSHARGVTVSIDESGGQSRTGRGRAFIGADGVHSRTRTQLLGGPAAQDRNRTAWRTLLQASDIKGKLPLDRVSVFLAHDFHAVTYPLPHRGQVNLALFSPRRSSSRDEESLPNMPGAPCWPHLDSILETALWTAWPMYTVQTSGWHKGNIGIIGDAAHAMVPFQAQGAAMGIEDAAVLAPLLVTEPNAEAAFRKFELLRQKRVNRVASTSASNGRIFHLPWPLSLGRNAVIAAQGETAHLRRLDWLYSYETPVLEVPGKSQNQDL